MSQPFYSKAKKGAFVPELKSWQKGYCDANRYQSTNAHNDWSDQLFHLLQLYCRSFQFYKKKLYQRKLLYRLCIFKLQWKK